MALVSENMEEKSWKTPWETPKSKGKPWETMDSLMGCHSIVVMKMMGPECFLGKVSTFSAGGSLSYSYPSTSFMSASMSPNRGVDR